MAIQQNFPAIKPTLLLDFSNTEALDSRVTFTRASTATYYGTETAKAEENLLVRSQELNLAPWTDPGTSVTANTEAAPDGTTTAETITADVGTAGRNVGQVVTSIAAVYTFSVFAKAGTLDYIQLRFALAVGGAFVNFDITSGAGAIGTSGGSGSPLGTITDVGNGWFRCSITATITAGAAAPSIFLVTSESAVSAESWTALGTETVFLWGCQLEQRSAATNYTPTTTQPITNYIPVLESAASGVARFDHNPVTKESLGLLIEEQRTNLLTYSEEFDNAAWTKSSATITANTIVSPDGTVDADKLISDSGLIGNINRPSLSFTSGTAVTASFYAKKGEFDTILLRVGSSAFTGTVAARTVTFNLTSGTVTSAGATWTSGSMTAVGNGWFRCVGTISPTSTATDTLFWVGNDTGDGFSGIFIWGASLEQGAFPTSFIPTVASQVTRAADAASMTGANFSSWYNQGAGTFYSDMQKNGSSSFQQVLNFNDNTTGNLMALGFGSNTFPLRLDVNVGGAMQASITGLATTTNNVVYKTAAAYEVNNFAISTNAAAVVTDTAGTVPLVTQMGIGFRNVSTGLTLTGTISKISYYPARLTDTQLQALTS